MGHNWTNAIGDPSSRHRWRDGPVCWQVPKQKHFSTQRFLSIFPVVIKRSLAFSKESCEKKSNKNVNFLNILSVFKFLFLRGFLKAPLEAYQKMKEAIIGWVGFWDRWHIHSEFIQNDEKASQKNISTPPPFFLLNLFNQVLTLAEFQFLISSHLVVFKVSNYVIHS